jgi:class 3 adenylate cyclase
MAKGTGRGPAAVTIERTAYDAFTPERLGLGNLAAPSRQVDVTCGVFDLAGFTRFCTQVDPHLAVPEYLSAFLEWLFDDLKAGIAVKRGKRSVEIYAPLPFFSKFMGDGVLFLWDTTGYPSPVNENIVGMLYHSTLHYKKQFLPRIRAKVSIPPPTLRCGVARGRVFSVGNGSDFVGPCINLAARLQKLSILSFSFSRRGLNADELHEQHRDRFILKRVAVRGIGDDELVYILRGEFDGLPPEEKALFQDP